MSAVTFRTYVLPGELTYFRFDTKGHLLEIGMKVCTAYVMAHR